MTKFFKNGEETNVVDFVETEVGSENTITLGIKNEYGYRVKIMNPISTDPEVKILKTPEALNPNETQEMVISFEPSMFRRTPLELSSINFRVLM